MSNLGPGRGSRIWELLKIPQSINQNFAVAVKKSSCKNFLRYGIRGVAVYFARAEIEKNGGEIYIKIIIIKRMYANLDSTEYIVSTAKISCSLTFSSPEVTPYLCDIYTQYHIKLMFDDNTMQYLDEYLLHYCD